jgi:L-lactate utilization protein LutC
MDERSFLERLRARRAGSPNREAPPLPPMPVLGHADALESLEQNGIAVKTAAPSQIAEAIAAIAGGAKTFACWKTPLLAPVAPRLAAAGAREIAYPESGDPRTVLDASEIGIVEAEILIAETGSIGLVPGPGRGLLSALLARTLIAVWPVSRRISRLDDVADWIAAKGPVNLSMISGASRTGDVAQKHILGAHGPAAVHVIAVPD